MRLLEIVEQTITILMCVYSHSHYSKCSNEWATQAFIAEKLMSFRHSSRNSFVFLSPHSIRILLFLHSTLNVKKKKKRKKLVPHLFGVSASLYTCIESILLTHLFFWICSLAQKSFAFPLYLPLFLSKRLKILCTCEHMDNKITICSSGSYMYSCLLCCVQ